MARMQLSLETLQHFDFGVAAKMFNQALKRAVLDVIDRGGDDRKRVVTLRVNIKPILLQDGDVVEAEVEFEAGTALPSLKTPKKPMTVNRQGQLGFSELAPDNPNQTTIDELTGEA